MTRARRYRFRFMKKLIAADAEAAPLTAEQSERARRDAELFGKLYRRMAEKIDGWRGCGHRVCRRAHRCAHADLACVAKHRASRTPATPEERAEAVAQLQRMLKQRQQQLRQSER